MNQNPLWQYPKGAFFSVGLAEGKASGSRTLFDAPPPAAESVMSPQDDFVESRFKMFGPRAWLPPPLLPAAAKKRKNQTKHKEQGEFQFSTDWVGYLNFNFLENQGGSP